MIIVTHSESLGFSDRGFPEVIEVRRALGFNAGTGPELVSMSSCRELGGGLYAERY